MATLKYSGDEITKEEVLQHFNTFIRLFENCPDDMIFKIDLLIDAIDIRFNNVIQLISEVKEKINQLDPVPGLSAGQVSDIVDSLQTFKDDENVRTKD